MSRILPHIPSNREVVDLFGGGGSIITSIGSGLWNDIDPRLYRVAVQLKADWKGLRDEALQIPIDVAGGTGLWSDLRTRLYDCSAAEFAWAAYFTWGGRLGGRFQSNPTQNRIWRNWLEALPARAEAWADIDISNKCALDFQWPSGATLIADPPYPRTAGAGYHDLGLDYGELLSRLSRHDGQTLLFGWEDSYPGISWPRREIAGGYRTSKNIGYTTDAGKLMHLFCKDGFIDPELNFPPSPQR